jgi:pimeloyl-ACP methyl ester carboxylesterase
LRAPALLFLWLQRDEANSSPLSRALHFSPSGRVGFGFRHADRRAKGEVEPGVSRAGWRRLARSWGRVWGDPGYGWLVSRIERFVSSDGTAIASHVGGRGPPLVLVHGTAADHTRWARVLDALGARFTTHALDRRGRGASADGGEYAIEREFEDVAAVIDAIGGDVDLLGHSYGAVCSLEATLHTPHVRRLMLYEPPLPVGIEIYPPGLVERLAALLIAGDRDGVVSTFMREVVRMPTGELDMVRRQLSWPARVAAAHTIPRELGIADSYQPDFGRFASVGVPTLLLVGGDSPPFLVEPTQRLHESITGSRQVVMAGQQHVAMDSAPDLFLEHIIGFLT